MVWKQQGDHLMLSCKKVSLLLSQKLDQPLPHMKRIELRIHLWMCSACSNFEKHLQFLHKAVGLLDEKQQLNGAKLSDAARKRIRKALLQ
jgi:hypothetical protein